MLTTIGGITGPGEVTNGERGVGKPEGGEDPGSGSLCPNQKLLPDHFQQ